MKKILLLGGSRYLTPVIEVAHNLGLYVITCDYLPDNDAHELSDEYRNLSIIDKDSVLAAAQEMNVDGVLSFACDPGVITAAYVAEKMGLPFQCPYQSAMILQDKGLFRKFLSDNQFNVPYAKRYVDVEAPYKDIDCFRWPVIVKPVDSAGSKGVTKVDSPDKLRTAVEWAMKHSHIGAFIIEEFLVFQGYHSSADSFTIHGDLKFITYSDQLFDKDADNPYTPAMIIWPSSMEEQCQKILTDETQRLMRLLRMETGIYNIETCVDVNGRPYIMEVSPRGGGCKIAEIQKLAFGVDLIENEVRKAVGLPVQHIETASNDGYWCEMVIHAAPGQSGILKRIAIDSAVEKKYVRVIDISAKEGSYVAPFTGANMALGDMFLRFDSRKELDDVMSQSSQWLQIELKDRDSGIILKESIRFRADKESSSIQKIKLP